MPFIIAFIGILLIVTGYKGTLSQLTTLLQGDLTGKTSFAVWLFAFFVIGLFGYIPAFKKLSDAFLLLVIVVIVIANDKSGGGFFANLQTAINNAGSGASSATTATAPSSDIADAITLPQLPTLGQVGAASTPIEVSSQ